MKSDKAVANKEINTYLSPALLAQGWLPFEYDEWPFSYYLSRPRATLANVDLVTQSHTSSSHFISYLERYIKFTTYARGAVRIWLRLMVVYGTGCMCEGVGWIDEYVWK